MESSLFLNLFNMIKDHDQYFNQGIAQYILNSSTLTEIQEQSFKNNSLKNYKLDTNLWGFISFTNKNSLFYSPEKNLDSNNLNNLQHFSQKEIWYQILNQFNPILLEESAFTLETYKESKGKKHIVSLQTVSILSDIKNWYILSQQSTGLHLTKEEEVLIIEDLFQENQTTTLHQHNLVQQPELAIFLLNKVSEHYKTVQKNFKKSNEEMTAKFFSSPAIKLLLTHSNADLSQTFFSESSLNTIMKKSSLKDNLATYPHMISTLFPIAPPEKWIAAYSMEEEFNINNFFGHLAKKIAHLPLAKISKNLKSKTTAFDNNKSSSSTGIKEMLSQLDYLGPVLKKIPTSEDNLQLLFTTILYSKNPDLYKKAREIYSLPEFNDNTQYFHNVLMNHSFIDKGNKTSFTFKYVEAEIFQEKLDNSLPIQSKKIAKMKI
jgi:hypothetical protein